MNLTKNIFSIFAAISILFASNGFILEKYFCGGCESDHKEVSVFEFGEISHDHDNSCSHTDACSCNDLDEHINSTEISYFFLDDVFLSKLQKITISETLVLSFDLFFVPNIVLEDVISNNLLFKPPLIKEFLYSNKLRSFTQSYRL